MTTGQRMKNRRKEIGLSAERIAEILGVSPATIYRYENGGIEKVPGDRLGPIASALQTTPAYLMGWEDSPSHSEAPIPTATNIFPMPKMKQWRVLGATACGEPIFKPLEEESVWAPADIDADYVFRCVGDSMIGAHIIDGDTVFVKSGVDVLDGQIGVVRIEDEYTLKRVYHGPDYLELKSENPKYPPIVIRGEQVNAQIVGRAVFVLTRVV